MYKILRYYAFKSIAGALFKLAFDIGSKTESLADSTLFNNLLKPVESAAADKEDIFSIYLYEFLMRIFAASHRGNA